MFSLFTFLAVTGYVLIFLWQLHQATLENAQRELKNLSYMLAEGSRNSFSATDQLLRGIREQIEIKRLRGEDTSPSMLHDMLRHEAVSMNSLRGLAIADSSGLLIAHSNIAEPRVLLSDRAYFRYHRDAQDDVPYLGPAVKSKLYGDWVFTLSRGLFKEKSRIFGGVVFAGINPSYFNGLFHSISPAAGTEISLVDSHGFILAGNTASGVNIDIGQKSILADKIRDLAVSNSSQSLSIEFLKNGSRYFSYIYFEQKYGVALISTISKDIVLKKWYQSLRISLIGIASLIVLIGVMTFLLLRQLIRTERAERIQKGLSYRLGRSLNLREAVINSSHQMILTTDLNGVIRTVNPAAEAAFGGVLASNGGRFLTELIDQKQFDIYQAELKKICCMLRDVPPIFSLTRYFFDGEKEWSCLDLDGSIIPVALSVTELKNSSGQIYGYVAIGYNLSERYKVEKMKKEFISTVSHELRTPLTAIHGGLGLLLSGSVGEIPDRVGKVLDIARRNSERLLLLINDILDIEKIESGAMRLNLRRCDVVDLLNQSIAMNQGYARECGVDLSLLGDLDKGAVSVYVDAQRFAQVMSNLISNAAKFSPAGAMIEISLAVQASTVCIRVKDYGIGISKAFQSKIFQKFLQGDSSDTRKKGGTGLGLAITRALVDAMYGTISFVSEEGEGTTFTVEFPLAEVSPSGEANRSVDF